MWTRFVALISRLRYAFVRARLDDEARREMETHLELLTDRNVRLGMPHDRARTEARRQLGNTLLVREEIFQMNSIGWLEELVTDARYGVRLLTRHRGFAIVATLTLALGIGATSAIFSVLNAVILAPLPFRDADRLVWIERLNDEGEPGLFGTDLMNEWRRESRTLDSISYALMGQPNFSITGPGGAERIVLEQVDVHTLTLLGVEPVLGRVFQPDETIVQGNSSQSIVISYGLWQRVFGGDPNVLGKKLPGWTAGWGEIIVGVMPRGFYIHPSRANADAWYVINFVPGRTFARLAPGVTVEQAQSELDTIARAAVARSNEDTRPDQIRIVVDPLADRYHAEYDRTLYLLLGAVGFVLLIATVNVANLQLNRGMTRHGEMATRMAMGAKRWRLLRQLIVENVILVLVGGALGVG